MAEQPESLQVAPWPTVGRFDDRNLPEFPTDALPGVLRDWVAAESHATQTPPDLAGLMALAVFSAAVARRVEVQPREGYREPVNLFVTVLLEPGNRKSAVFADAVRPLEELEDELVESARPSVAREQSERRQSEARLRKLEKGDAHEAGQLAAELAEQPGPVLPRLIVDDVTCKKLGMLLAAHGGRIASMSQVGGVFDRMAGPYFKSGVYRMGHSGGDLVTDRVGRKQVCVERPALTCAYAVPPQVVTRLAAKAAFRGRGLLARFLYAAPQSWIGRRQVDPTPVPAAVREAYRQRVRQLASLDCEVTLSLDDDARAEFEQWETEVEQLLDDGGPLELMRDWGSKLAGATLRVAGVMHCVEFGPEGRVTAKTILAAVRVARYLVPHAEAVLQMMASEEKPDDARYLLRWAKRHQRREFTRSEAQQHCKKRFPKVDDIDSALAELTRRGYIRLRPSERGRQGRPTSPRYEVNPAVGRNT